VIWSLVQSTGVQTSGGAVTNVAATFPGSVTAGNLVVAMSSSYFPPNGCLDSINSVQYTLGANSSSAQNDRGYIYWYVPPVGGNGFQVKVTASSFYAVLCIAEFTYGAGSTYSADGANANQGSSSSPSAGPVTPTSSDLIVGCMAYQVSTTRTPGSPFTEIYGANYTSNSIGGSAVYVANESIAENPSWTLGALSAWGAAALAFRATGGSGGLILVDWEGGFRQTMHGGFRG
jgi:hypothetical protein